MGLASGELRDLFFQWKRRLGVPSHTALPQAEG